MSSTILIAVFFLIHSMVIRRSSFVVLFLIFSVYHWLLFAVFQIISKGQITDAHNYFFWASDPNYEIGFGTGFIVLTVKALAVLGIQDYISVSTVFSGLSLTGIALTYKALIDGVYFTPRVVALLSFLFLCMPGLHFWTGAIGKDALIIFSTGLLMFSVSRGFSILKISFALLVMLLVRPHVGLTYAGLTLLYLYYTKVSVVDLGTKALLRIFILILVPLIIVLSYFFVFGYVQKYAVDGFSSLGEFAASRMDVYEGVGSGFDASAYPYFLRVIFFILGGMPNRVSDIFQLAAILEGLVLFFMLFYLSFFLTRKRRLFLQQERRKYNAIFYFFSCSVAVILILSILSSNFGLIARQRVMCYLPVFVAFFHAAVIRHKIKLSRGRTFTQSIYSKGSIEE